MKKLLIGALILFLAVSGNQAFAGYKYKKHNANVQQVQIVQKNAFFEVVPYQVLGIPVNPLGLEYYWTADVQGINQKYQKQTQGTCNCNCCNCKSDGNTTTTNNGNSGNNSGTDDNATDDNTPEKPDGTETTDHTDLDRKVYAIFKESCSTCHNTTKANKDLILDAQGVRRKSGKPVSARNVWKIYETVNNGEMPQGKAPLSDDNVKLIQQWVDSQLVDD